MNTPIFRWVLFTLMALAQIAVPVSLIIKYECVLSRGTSAKFVMAPRDPYDPFRGRYMQLSFDQTRDIPVKPGDTLRKNQTAYASFDIDANGYASLVEVTGHKPWHEHYLKVRVNYVYGGNASITLPFDRYYMNEHDAPQAEYQLAERWRNRRMSPDESSPRQDYAVVRILNGAGVIEGVFVDGKPIEDLLSKTSP